MDILKPPVIDRRVGHLQVMGGNIIKIHQATRSNTQTIAKLTSDFLTHGICTYGLQRG